MLALKKFFLIGLVVALASLSAIAGKSDPSKATIGFLEIKSLKQKIPTMKNITELTIRADCSSKSDKLTIPLPDELGQLSKLETLNIGAAFGEEGRQDCNLATSLPSTLVQLSQLKVLSVDDAIVVDKKILASIGQLKALEKLRLTRNKNPLQTFPDELKGLTQLTQIDFSYNEIKAIPDFVGALANLEMMDLRQNKIGEISLKVAQNKALKKILLGNNSLNLQKQKAFAKMLPQMQLDFSNLWDDASAND